MSWFRCDDQLADHPKVMALDALRVPAIGLWTLCGTYCARHLTDGFVPRGVAVMYGGRDAKKLTDALVRSGLFVVVDGGWRLHDYLDWNPSREKVLAERAAAKARMEKRRSPDVRPNNARTEPEVQPRFGDPVPVPVSQVLQSVPLTDTGAFDFVEPSQLYEERTGRKVTQKVRDWLDDIHTDVTRAKLIEAMRAAPDPRRSDWLARVDAIARPWRAA